MSIPHVAIVGSGVAGACLAQHLLENGAADKVTMLEAGPHIPERDYRKWLDHLLTGDRPYRGLEDRPGDMVDLIAQETGEASFRISGSRLLLRGGSTFHWGGWALRFKEEDMATWPFDYDHLSPYYLRAEHFLRVAGDAGVEDPPRNGAAYPLDAVPYTRKDEKVIEAMSDTGLEPLHLPIARNERCLTTGTCKYCPVGGIYSAQATLDYLELRYGEKFDLRVERPVVGLHTDRGTVTGLTYTDGASGGGRQLHADVFVVCAGAIESPKLLLASEGVASRLPKLGRHLLTHRLFVVDGWLRSQDASASMVDWQQVLDFPTLACRSLDTPAGKKVFFVHEPRFTMPVDIREELTKAPAAPPTEAVAKVAQDISDSTKFALNAFMETFDPDGDNFVGLGEGKTAVGLPTTKVRYRDNPGDANPELAMAPLKAILKSIGIPEDRINVKTEKTPRADHACGTCRMATSEADGVVDGNLRVFGMTNLYVCSNAVLPNSTAVNPTLTLSALAIRLADHLGA